MRVTLFVGAALSLHLGHKKVCVQT